GRAGLLRAAVRVRDARGRAAEAGGREVKSVAEICSDLIRFDTTNPGDGERPAAEYVATLLADAGLEPEVFEPAPRRPPGVARVAGDSPDALLVHGRLDVGPADPAEGRTHPCPRAVAGRCGHGRGRGQ